jgi:hypothetical protein
MSLRPAAVAPLLLVTSDRRARHHPSPAPGLRVAGREAAVGGDPGQQEKNGNNPDSVPRTASTATGLAQVIRMPHPHHSLGSHGSLVLPSFSYAPTPMHQNNRSGNPDRIVPRTAAESVKGAVSGAPPISSRRTWPVFGTAKQYCTAELDPWA